jgi:hypothetical protein
MSEVTALAAYGLLVSWPYLSIIRGNPPDHATFVDMLDLVDLHWRLPIFCMCLAISPGLFLDRLVPDSELTIDGNPPINPGLLEAVRQAGKELPYVREMTTALFTGM